MHRSHSGTVRRLCRSRPHAVGFAALAATVGFALSVTALAACSGSAGRSAAAATGPASASTAASAAASPSGNAIAAENAKPGTTAWTIPDSAIGPQDAIQGYTDQASVTPGQSFKLFVSTTAPSFTATAYRIGYYGGTNGREVWQSPVRSDGRSA